MLKIAVHGVAGRMGRAVVRVVQEAQDAQVRVALDSPGSELLGRDAGELAGVGTLGVAIGADLSALADADVVIDFSLPPAVPALLEACRQHEVAPVIATTGLSTEQVTAIDGLAEKLPLVYAPNYSTGVTALFHLAAQASRMLSDFDAEVVEMHHRHKVDAPSGTALGLARAAAQARGQDLDQDGVFARHGHTGARTDAEIGVMTLRGGDVVGEHTLILAGAGERLEITHRATDRSIFARGALRAARWVVGQPAGRYDMANVLGL